MPPGRHADPDRARFPSARDRPEANPQGGPEIAETDQHGRSTVICVTSQFPLAKVAAQEVR